MKSGNSRIEELIERYQMGVTDEDEVAELEQALKENAGMREALIAAARLDTILHEEALNAAVDAESKRVDFPQPIISSKAVFAAAAAVVALALLIQFQDNRPTGPDSAQALVTPVAESKSESAPRDTVARLVAVVDAEWRDDGLQPGGALAIGGFVLNRGTADMEFNDGARISLRGPAVFELKAANHLHLISGKLVANIPDDGLGFLLTTPQSEVIDLGTEFGLAVDGAGRTDVHVISGLVEVYEPRNPDDPLGMRSIQTGIKIAEGQARRLETDGGFRDLAEAHCAIALQGRDPGVGGGRDDAAQGAMRDGPAVMFVKVCRRRRTRPRPETADGDDLLCFGEIDQDRRDAGEGDEFGFKNGGGDTCRRSGINRVAACLQHLQPGLGPHVVARRHHVAGSPEGRSGGRRRWGFGGHVRVFPGC